MVNTCEVCSLEPSKYRCPACGLLSCSLGCTQSHKIYCEPKPQLQNSSEAATTPNAAAIPDATPHPETDANEHANEKQSQPPNLETLTKSPELQDLFRRYPQLRDHLRDIYQTTLEEEWVEVQQQPYPGRGRGRGRTNGRGRGMVRNRGTWTREKGFNRGLGKVRKFRERCEEGLELGKDAEGFMRFIALVNGENQSHEPA